MMSTLFVAVFIVLLLVLEVSDAFVAIPPFPTVAVVWASGRRRRSNANRRGAAVLAPTFLQQQDDSRSIDGRTTNRAEQEFVGSVTLLLPSSSSSTKSDTTQTANTPSSLTEFATSIAQNLLSSCDNKNRAIFASVVTCRDEYSTICDESGVLLALGVEAPMDVQFVATIFAKRRASGFACCQFALEGRRKTFAPLLDAYDEANPTRQQHMFWTAAASDKRLLLKMQALFDRGDVDGYVEAIQLLFARKTGRKSF